MKLNYFQQSAPDLNDRTLLTEIERGTVPAGCLNGGVEVAGARLAGDDPCQSCEGPRERCGGRPAAEGTIQTPYAVDDENNDSPEARAKSRETMRRGLDAIVRSHQT